MELSQFKALTPQELEKAIYSDRSIDISAKEHVVGHDWFDYEGSFTAAEEDAIHAYKAGILFAVRHFLR